MKSEVKINIWEKLALRLFASWCLATVITSLKVHELMYNKTVTSNMSMSQLLVYMFVIFLLVSGIDVCLSYWKKCEMFSVDIVFFVASVIFFGISAVFNQRDQYLASMIAFALIICISYVVRKYTSAISNEDIKKRTMIIFVVFVGVCTFALMGTMTVLRYKMFNTSTFDFGIFCQMFYNMKETFLPMTTCERNVLLSHFAVHISPIYYLILPIYCLFPYNETLIVVQLLFIISGVIPLMLICKHRRMSNLITMFLGFAYLVSPVLFGGLFYDFHENKFLTTFILWLLYFVEKEKKIGIYFFAILVLMVKEDAGIYVACVGLYMLATKVKKEKIHGLIIFLMSVIWFLLAYNWLKNSGDGAMTNRYSNYISNPDGSVFEILVTIVKNPAYFFRQLLNLDKLSELMWVVVPLLFMPFRIKSLKELILLIPFLVLNLMPSYVYQYNIAHQYFYGSFALMLYVAIVNMNVKNRVETASISIYIAVASLIMFTSYVTTNVDNIFEYANNKEKYETIAEALDNIPKDASVSVTTYFMPNVSMRKEVYRYPEGKNCEYVVFDMTRVSYLPQYYKDISTLENQGYVVEEEYDGMVVIMRKNKASQ